MMYNWLHLAGGWSAELWRVENGQFLDFSIFHMKFSYEIFIGIFIGIFHRNFSYDEIYI
jgi:hypothetical protein